MAASIIGSLPAKVQTGEKFRIDLTRSYVHVSEHNIHEMDITVDGVTYDILNTKYFDYDFSTTGNKTLSVNVTTSGQGHPASAKDFTIEVVSQAEEKLFNSDEDILSYEPGMYPYLPDGKADFKWLARIAQTAILAKLDEMGIHDSNGGKLTIDDVTDITEFHRWSTFMSLRILMEGLSNQVGDIWHEKYLRYSEMEEDAKNRAIIRMDLDNDGTADDKIRNMSGGIFRK